ncbi:hypothetical protein [Actinoplanes teichomyceticus]|uniref:Uncharacterized protein n=1 Tax=Actinoplanes teichomyceticus TaxID=1867 RepID=A0A561WK63_ACTTI|nr:hypothetical protein [Actinoplanes teichomyceticus]TWG24252.1 hypothetical protein FHX34_102805 [Actinoplanes teichomyceticus]GIF12902.1 hypothetical protein Ate01nite_29340 [Actinoplanes teichomyceticus]
MTVNRALRVRLTHETEEATASGVYGIIVGAAVLVAGHGESVRDVVVAVLVTLLVYWAAERYARIVAERIHQGRRPARHVIREQLTAGWEIVTASGLPLLVLILVRLSGARLITAEIVSLACSTLLLAVAGWRIGANGRLSTGERVQCTVVAGMFGVVLIILKTLLH